MSRLTPVNVLTGFASDVTSRVGRESTAKPFLLAATPRASDGGSHE